ncbi:MAG: glycoside hydrolase family 30 protein [Lachnospirales bacterium]
MQKGKIISTFYNNELKKTESSIAFEKDFGVEMHAINIYPEIEFQKIEGFGGALTEATAYTYSLMDKETKKEFINLYFGKKGANYEYLRMSLDSCDFSLGNYSAVEDKNDIDFKTFTLEKDEKYILPLLRDILKVKKNIKIMLSPWSPPAFMKTNGQKNQGGKLKPNYRLTWAKYICKYICEYRKLGFNVTMLTIQNEPKATQKWDSCVYTGAEEKDFLENYLFPELIKNNMDDIDIYFWDHNKERILERSKEVIDSNTDNMLTGVAFHWYSGDHFEELELFKKLHPNKKLIFTEGCVEYSRFSNNSLVKNAHMYARDIIGNLNGGMNIFLDWNILLDNTGGPNHVKNYCDAPIMYNFSNGNLIKKLSYDFISQISKYGNNVIKIGHSKYSEDIDVVAFKNNENIFIIILNKTQKIKEINLRINGLYSNFNIVSNSISTIIL